MKKIIGIIGIIITFFIIYFLHVNFFSWFTISGIKPNLFIILVLVLGLFAGKKVGAITGLIIGIYLEILTSKSVGIMAFLLMGLGFIGGKLDKTFSKDSKLTIIIIVLSSTICYEFLYYLYNVFKFSMNFELWSFIKITGVQRLPS